MSTKISSKDLHLTEIILALHHEVQSAIDYISDVSAKQGTELGKSTALMGIENLRLKLPLSILVEQKTQKVAEKSEVLFPDDIRRNLASRKGFLIDRGTPGKMGVFTKIKVSSGSGPAMEDAPDNQYYPGEIELTFSPLKRD